MKTIFAGVAIAVLVTGCVSPAQRAQNQADMNASVPICKGKKQCDVEWQAASAWVSHNCGMKIQTVTDAMIQTFNSPPNSPSTACTVTRVPGPGQSAAFQINVGCANLFGCVPASKDQVIAFGADVKAAGAPYELLKVGFIGQDVDSHGQLTKVLAEAAGFKVVSVMSGSRADTAGVKPDDVILAFNGKRVRNQADWIELIQDVGPGDIVALKVRRAGQDVPLSMPL